MSIMYYFIDKLRTKFLVNIECKKLDNLIYLGEEIARYKSIESKLLFLPTMIKTLLNFDTIERWLFKIYSSLNK